MESFKVLLLSIGGGSGIVMIVECFRFWRSKKKVQIEKAKQEEVETEVRISKTWREYADTLKIDYENYKNDTNKKIENLELKIEKMERREKIRDVAILLGWTCAFLPNGKRCPILDEIELKSKSENKED